MFDDQTSDPLMDEDYPGIITTSCFTQTEDVTKWNARIQVRPVTS